MSSSNSQLQNLIAVRCLLMFSSGWLILLQEALAIIYFYSYFIAFISVSVQWFLLIWCFVAISVVSEVTEIGGILTVGFNC